MDRISISSVLIGQIVDKVLFIPLISLFIYTYGVEGQLFSISALVIGASCTCLGSFVAANRAKDLFIEHGVAVGAITFALSFIRFLMVQAGDEPSVHSLHWEIVAWVSAIVAGYAGGYLARSRSSRSDA